MNHLTLSGRNGEPLGIRAVYVDGEQIGTVVQNQVSKSWFALGMNGEQHGFYTTDWNAAKQLALALGKAEIHAVQD